MPVSKNRRRKRKTGKAHPANAKQRRPADMQPATEADFEARLSAVLKQALAFIAPGSVQHQRRFSIRLGHNDLQIDGSAGATALGRLDILLISEDRPRAEAAAAPIDR